MDNLVIAATERSPEVNFDFEGGQLSLKGESYPEDASSVFGPIFAALELAVMGGKPRRIGPARAGCRNRQLRPSSLSLSQSLNTVGLGLSTAALHLQTGE